MLAARFCLIVSDHRSFHWGAHHTPGWTDVRLICQRGTCEVSTPNGCGASAPPSFSQSWTGGALASRDLKDVLSSSRLMAHVAAVAAAATVIAFNRLFIVDSGDEVHAARSFLSRLERGR